MRIKDEAEEAETEIYDEDVQAFTENPHTRKLLKDAETCCGYSFTTLLQACKSSSDPKVVAAFMKWEHYKTVADVLKGTANGVN